MAGFLGISRDDWFEAFSTGGMSLILNKEKPMKKHDHHDHCRCEESLGLCKRCDVVFCAKCSKEWGAECTLSHSPYWYIRPQTPTADITFSDSDSTSACSHTV